MNKLCGFLETNADPVHLNSLIRALKSEGHYSCALKFRSVLNMREKYPNQNALVPPLSDKEFAGFMSVWAQSMGAFEFKQFFSFIPEELVDIGDYRRYYEIRKVPIREIMLKLWLELDRQEPMDTWGNFEQITKCIDEILVGLKRCEYLDLGPLIFISGFWGKRYVS